MTEPILRYLRLTPPWKLVMHLVWIASVLCMLSVSYIITFHFPVVMEAWNKSHSLQNFSAELGTSIALDTVVTEELTKLLLSTKSNRAYLYRYHNGIPSTNNVPFIFHTNTHEVISPGTNRAIMMNQRVPTSILFGMNQEFTKKKCVALADIDHDSTGANHWHYTSRNAVALVRCPFFSKTGDLIGFVGIDWTEDPKKADLDRAMAAVEATAQNIGAQFNSKASK